jgi:uncharacterized protein YjiS (DUF1127 family)
MFTRKVCLPFRRWRARMVEHRSLASLSEYQLSDIGLTRADVAVTLEPRCPSDTRSGSLI